MNKICFLDFDGVLNNDDEWNVWRQMSKSATLPAGLESRDCIDRGNVANLNKLVLATSAKFVVSSTWREFHSLDWLQNHLNSFGFIGELIGQTIVLPPVRMWQPAPRGNEIKDWLNRFPSMVDKFVILDDNYTETMDDFLVLTDSRIGLTDADVKRAIEMLK
jgi:hypothetical protein